VELHHVLADDDHTGALLRCTAQRDGKTLDMNYVLVFHTAAARSPRLEDVQRPGSARRILDEDAISPDTSRSDPDRYELGLVLAVTR
jgi:hypothetical protein